MLEYQLGILGAVTQYYYLNLSGPITIKQGKYRCGKTVGYLLQSQNPREHS